MPNAFDRDRRLQFGDFVANLRERELWRRGVRIPLEAVPFTVLAALLKANGEIVSREELQAEVWPAHKFVDVDSGLRTAVSKVRRALGDSATNPTFVETAPRRGYRILANVRPVHGAAVTLAVLPLRGMAGGETTATLSAGLTDHLITHLATMDAIQVLSTPSTRSFDELATTIREIGKELAADLLVTGAIYRKRTRVLVTLQLIELPSECVVWAESLETSTRKEFNLQREWAQTLAVKIHSAVMA